MSGAILVSDGPRLLAGFSEGPAYDAHLRRFGRLPLPDADRLLQTVAALMGRGGARFPFAIKLEAALRRRFVPRYVVVNWSEGEPASWKDTALALGRVHLVLDGAAVGAHALHAREVHLVLPGENPDVVAAVERAVAERADRVRWCVHLAEDRFVAGQAQAVLQLMSGRPGLPVTAWKPEAVAGHKGRPTLLSNAETWAQVALLVRDEALPETTLLTLDGESAQPRVVEVADGTPWTAVVGGGPHLIGGYHGVWVSADRLRALRVHRAEMQAAGVPLGAGAAIPLRAGECPVAMTARITDYLAGESAGRCGPCVNGLPALADQVAGLARGRDTTRRIAELCGLVDKRGACAHPDGTARMVRSLLTEFPDDVAAHAAGRCTRERMPA